MNSIKQLLRLLEALNLLTGEMYQVVISCADGVGLEKYSVKENEFLMAASDVKNLIDMEKVIKNIIKKSLEMDEKIDD